MIGHDPDTYRRRVIQLIVVVVAAVVFGTAVIAQQPPPIWRWDFPDIVATVNRVRSGRDLTPKTWPGGRVAVALSFDLDAETLFLRSGQLSPQPLSRGEYGARVGTPRILALLEKHRIPASFFIPTVAAELHPEAIDAILKSPLKHEIGVHGWVTRF